MDVQLPVIMIPVKMDVKKRIVLEIVMGHALIAVQLAAAEAAKEIVRGRVFQQ
jgi:hypothetical protein